MLDAVIIRPYRDTDAEGIANLYRRFNYGPAAAGYPLSTEDFQRMLLERGAKLFLVAEFQEQSTIVGTMGFFSISGQKMIQPNEIFASNFFIHPEFRKSRIPAQLFTKTIEMLVDLGIDVISTEVDPTDTAALGLYKRVGLYRTQACPLDYDGYLELRSYLPYVIRTLKEALPTLTSWDQSKMFNSWKYLLPTRNIRTSAYDSEQWHGLEVVRYNMNMFGLKIVCLVDTLSGGMVSIETDQINFQMYPSCGQVALAEQRFKMLFKLENVSNKSYHCSLKMTTAGDERTLLSKQLLEKGDNWNGNSEITASSQPENLFSCILSIDDLNFKFHLSMQSLSGLTYQRIGLPELLEPAQTGQVTLRITNPWEYILQGQLLATSSTLHAIQIQPASFVLTSHSMIDINVSYVPSEHGLHEMQIDLLEQNGQRHSLESLKLAVPASCHPIAYEEQSSYILASQFLHVRLSKTTGSMEIIDKASKRIVITEAWPDAGPPFLGGIKRSAARQLEGTCSNEEAEMSLSILEKTSLGACLQRTIRFRGDHLVFLQHEWQTSDHQDESVKQLNTHGWCNFRKAMLSIPLQAGIDTQAVIYEDYPYQLHDFECQRGDQLPWQTNAYAGEWSAFQENELVAGMLWKDATEIRYGLRWMPSLIFTLAAPATMQTYAYYVGPGDARTVEHAWKMNFCSLEDMPMEQEEHPSISTRGITQMGSHPSMIEHLFQSLEIPWATEANPVAVKEISDHKGNKTYQVDNGVLQFRVAPEFSGSIYQLVYKEENLLQSPYPHIRTFGQNAVWYGGIHPYKLPDRENLLASVMPDTYHQLNFRAQATESTGPDGQHWQGVALYDETSCIKYLTRPSMPLLYINAQFENSENTKHSFDLVFHIFLRSLMGSREKKTFYYERLGQVHKLTEAHKRRKVYSDDWGVVELGKNVYVTFFAPPEENLEVAAYEWPGDGLQNVLLQKVCMEPKQIGIYQAYVMVSDSLKDAITYGMALGKARPLEDIKL